MKMLINMNDEVRKTLEENSKRFGLSMSAYLSSLVMKADLELQMAKLLKAMDSKMLEKAIREQAESEELKRASGT